jgi:hypothetical protein
MVSFGMSAALKDAVRVIAVPAEFAGADLGIVESDADAVL